MQKLYKCNYKGELQKDYGLHENRIIKEANYIGLYDEYVIFYSEHPDDCLGWLLPWDVWAELKEDKSFLFEEVINEN